MSKPFDVSGRVVAITGGSGQLGSAWARWLLDQGALVAILDVSDSGASALPGTNWLWVKTDVSDRNSVAFALRTVAEHWRLWPRALINAAALDTPPGGTAPDFDRAMAVNIKGVTNCCEIIGGAMVSAGGGGGIVNIGSIYGLVSPDQRIYLDGFEKPLAYSATKAAVYGITRWYATRYARSGVRVNALTLGGVENNPHSNPDPEFARRYSERVPMGRMAQPDEYNAAIQFLVSDASRYMTGANLVIDGGLTAW